jgi:hypothetical protein
VALVHGASGMGKSALVQAFLDDVALPRGAVVLQGRCYERESVPYKALDSAMDGLARHLARMPVHDAAALLPRDVDSLTRVFPVLRRAQAVAAAPRSTIEVSDAAEVRRRAFAALRELLARIADRTPLVLWADDLQWGDADSADLLASLLRPPDAPAMLVIGSYRREDAASSAFLAAALPAFEGLAEKVDVAVDPLGEREAADLAVRLTGGDPERAAAVARESRGSPFFVHELAEFGAEAPVGDVTLDAVVADRVERLPPEARRLLEVVAVSGGPVPRTSAVRAADVDAAARPAVAALRTGRLVRIKGAAPDDQLDTYHDRIRETVLARLTPDDTRQCHRRLGVALELAADVEPEKLAVHFHGGGESVRAGAHYEAAADAAARALAFVHAARLYQLALDLRGVAGEERRKLLAKRAHALRDGRRSADAAAAFLAAAEGAPHEEAFDLRCLSGEQYVVSGHVEEGLVVFRDVLRSVGMTLPRSEFLWIAGALAQQAWLAVRGTRFVPRREADVPRVLKQRVDVMMAFAFAYSHVQAILSWYVIARCFLLALRAGETRRIASVIPLQRCYATAWGGARGCARMDRTLRAAADLTASVDEPIVEARRRVAESFIAFHAGRWRTAATAASAADAIVRERCPGAAFEFTMATLYRCMALDFLGEFRALPSVVEEAIRDATERGDLYLNSAVRARLAPVVCLARGDDRAAAAEIERGRAEWSRPDFDVHAWWRLEIGVTVRLYGGDVVGARELVEADRRRLQRSQLLHLTILRTIAAGLRGRTGVALAALPGTDARERSRLLRAAAGDAALAQRQAVGGAAPWGLLLRAAIEEMNGRRDRAAESLARAEREFADSEMAAHAAVAVLRRGQITAGDGGRALVAAADERLRELGMSDPRRWADACAPGRWE